MKIRIFIENVKIKHSGEAFMAVQKEKASGFNLSLLLYKSSIHFKSQRKERFFKEVIALKVGMCHLFEVLLKTFKMGFLIL